MYDEPFAGLDPISLGTSARLIGTLNDTLGLTSIVVSHDVQETFHVADQVIILGAGGVAAQARRKRSWTTPIRWCSSSSTPARRAGAVSLPAPSLAQDFGGCAMNLLAALGRGTWANWPLWAAPRGCSCNCWACFRPAWGVFAWWASKSISWAITRWPSSACRGCSWVSCWACRATTPCSAMVRPRRWACWWRFPCYASWGRWSRRCCLQVAPVRP